MKKILLLAAFAALWTSCSDNDDCVSGRIEEIRVTPLISLISQIAPTDGTRTSYAGTTASWINGDALGLFCPTISATNVQFTASNIPATPTWTPSTAIYWQDGITPHTFLAYYPYAAGNTAAAVKLPALNTQTGALTPALDVMISNNVGTVGVLRALGAVNLIFTHALSLVEFDIKLGSGFAAGTTLTSFTLAGGATDKVYTTDATSTIALSTGIITPGTTVNTLTLTPATPPVLTTTATPFYALILPGTYLASTLTVALKDGGVTPYSTAAIPVVTLAFLPATKYSYVVTISRNAITISNPMITDWTPVTGTPLNPTI